jgi:gas vesicle protein
MAQRQTTPATATAVRVTGRQAARSGSRVKSRAADEASEVASTATDQASEVASTATERGQEVVSLATDEARQVGGAVKDQATRVGGEVVEQGRSLAEEARTQVEQQAHAQSRRLADTLSKVGDEVRALAEGRPEEAENVKPYVSNAADALYDAADRLYGLASDIDSRGITGVLDDLQSFARRRPGAFLMGAAVAGFGIGRAVRANSADGSSGNGASADAPALAGAPARVTGRPAIARAPRGR